MVGPSEDGKDTPSSQEGAQDVSNNELPAKKQGETQVPPEDQNKSMQELPSSLQESSAPKQDQSGTIVPPGSSGANADSNRPVHSSMNSDLARKTMDDVRPTNRKRNLDGNGGVGGSEGSPQPTGSSTPPLSYATVTQTQLSNPPPSSPPVKKPKNDMSSGTGPQPPIGGGGQDTPPPGLNSNQQVCDISMINTGTSPEVKYPVML